MDLITDIRVREAAVRFDEFALRTPFVLSHGSITHLCRATAKVRVEDGHGHSTEGLGMIFLSDLWSWPSTNVPSADRVRTMRAICEVMADGLPNAANELAHPFEHGLHLAETYVPYITKPAARVMRLPEDVPHLAGMVCFSPFDAAMHDAYGMLHGCSSYDTLNPALLPDTLERWLGEAGESRHLSEFIRRSPDSRQFGWHVIGVHDALTPADVSNPTPDELPDCVEGWIEREGVFGFKLKITGTQPEADAARTAEVYRLAQATHPKLSEPASIRLEVDANEAYPTAEVVVEYLQKLRDISPEAYGALQFLEQPVSRDADPSAMDLRAVSALKPVFVDEGMTSYRMLPRLEQAGWNGIALKTCKGHSFALLSAAWCDLRGWPYAMMDLTNPGLAVVHAAVLAGHLNSCSGIELNCRQYAPDALGEISEHLPGLARMTDGYFDFTMSDIRGLGYPAAMRKRMISLFD